MPKKVDRARLFLSFDALKGFKELLVEDTSIPRKELCEDQCYELDWKIHQLKEENKKFSNPFDGLKAYVENK